MVARGDLGVELALEKVPGVQKRAVRLCRERAKPVIVATQMLDSMIGNPRPTRAETSDVANAVLDGADALMLSGETSVGKYAIESVRTMGRIIAEVESEPLAVEAPIRFDSRTQSGLIATSARDLAEGLHAEALVAFTQSGDTVRRMARLHPRLPLLAFTPIQAVRSQLALSWGAETFLVPEVETTDQMVRLVDDELVKIGRYQVGSLVVIVAGSPPSTPGSTNLIRVHRLEAGRLAAHSPRPRANGTSAQALAESAVRSSGFGPWTGGSADQAPFGAVRAGGEAPGRRVGRGRGVQQPQRDPQLGPNGGRVHVPAEQAAGPADAVAQRVPVHAERRGGRVPFAVVFQPVGQRTHQVPSAGLVVLEQRPQQRLGHRRRCRPGQQAEQAGLTEIGERDETPVGPQRGAQRLLGLPLGAGKLGAAQLGGLPRRHPGHAGRRGQHPAAQPSGRRVEHGEPVVDRGVQHPLPGRGQVRAAAPIVRSSRSARSSRPRPGPAASSSRTGSAGSPPLRPRPTGQLAGGRPPAAARRSRSAAATRPPVAPRSAPTSG